MDNIHVHRELVGIAALGKGIVNEHHCSHRGSWESKTIKRKLVGRAHMEVVVSQY